MGLSFPSEADKDEVLEFMKQLKPPSLPTPTTTTNATTTTTTKEGIPSDALRRKLFSTDKDLEALYGQLVTNGIISESDFWKPRKHLLTATTTTKTNSTKTKQRSGLSSVMHEVEQLHDGQTERVNISLTPTDIQRIFIERPEVHRAFLARVPHALSETEFWQKYFKLEYKKAAKRKRLAAAGRFDVGDDVLDLGDELFAPFRRQLAEQEAKEAKSKIRFVDPTVNLVAGSGERWGVMGMGGGGGDEDTLLRHRQEQEQQMGGGTGSTAIAIESLARDLNRHSAHVLEGALDGLEDDEEGDGRGTKVPRDTAAIAAQVAVAIQRHASKSNAGASGSSAVDKNVAVDEERLQEWRERAVSALEDLSLEKDTLLETVPLDVRDPRAYFGGGGDIGEQKKEEEDEMMMDADLRPATTSFSFSDIHPYSLPNPPCPPPLAYDALLEVATGGGIEAGASMALLLRRCNAAAATAVNKPPQDALGSVMIEFFRLEALKTNEMLRLLWSCFPSLVSSQHQQNQTAKRAKASTLATALEQHKQSLEAHVVEEITNAQQFYVAHMVLPMIESIAVGLAQYEKVLRGTAP